MSPHTDHLYHLEEQTKILYWKKKSCAQCLQIIHLFSLPAYSCRVKGSTGTCTTYNCQCAAYTPDSLSVHLSISVYPRFLFSGLSCFYCMCFPLVTYCELLKTSLIPAEHIQLYTLFQQNKNVSVNTLLKCFDSVKWWMTVLFNSVK